MQALATEECPPLPDTPTELDSPTLRLTVDADAWRTRAEDKKSEFLPPSSAIPTLTDGFNSTRLSSSSRSFSQPLSECLTVDADAWRTRAEDTQRVAVLIDHHRRRGIAMNIS